MIENLTSLIKEHNVAFADLRFTDLRGKEHHITLPINRVDANLLQQGKVIDGSSLSGWQDIHRSDLILMPLANSAVLDPFAKHPTLLIRCNVYDPATKLPYLRDPRAVLMRAEQFMQASNIADACYFGQEVEFFVFDDVRWALNIDGCFYHLDSAEAAWNNATCYEGGNFGHRPGIKGGYFPVPPVDSSQNLRSAICQTLATMGLVPEVHHHEVATANQNEITTRYNTIVAKADEMQLLKYVVHNIAHSQGKSATFMPKPIVGDNGSGLHCHQSLAKDGQNIFAGKTYAGLSDLALYYIGGIIKHGRALNAFTNASTNSYKRLVPGYEAPVTMVYSAGNRSAAIRIPHAFTPQEARIEARFPDATANPYLAFAAMLMAGLDGIINKIHPGDAVDENLYALPLAQTAQLPSLCTSLASALESLAADQQFLLAGGVFSEDLLAAYIALKRSEVERLNNTTHPVEFDLYYSL